MPIDASSHPPFQPGSLTSEFTTLAFFPSLLLRPLFRRRSESAELNISPPPATNSCPPGLYKCDLIWRQVFVDIIKFRWLQWVPTQWLEILTRRGKFGHRHNGRKVMCQQRVPTNTCANKDTECEMLKTVSWWSPESGRGRKSPSLKPSESLDLPTPWF